MQMRPQALLVPLTTNAVLLSQITGRSDTHTRARRLLRTSVLRTSSNEPSFAARPAGGRSLAANRSRILLPDVEEPAVVSVPPVTAGAFALVARKRLN
jgi:hypothetical protein